MTQPTAWPPQPIQAPEPLFTSRRSANGVLMGVCDGLARRRGIDPVLVRVGFALLGLSMGVGVGLYLFCALWMTREDESEPLIHRLAPGTRVWSRPLLRATAIALALVSMLALSNLIPWGPLPGLVLLVVWVWARRDSARRQSAGMAASTFPDPAAPLDPAARAWQQRLEAVYLHDHPLPLEPLPAPSLLPQTLPPQARVPHSQQWSSVAPAGLYDPEPGALPTPMTAAGATVAHPRKRGRSWPMTLLMWGCALAAGMIGNAVHPVPTDPARLPAALALAVVAGFLVLGAFWRRPHLAILTGIVCACMAFSTPMTLQGAGPQGRVAYSAATPLPAALTITARESVLDMTKVPLEDDRTLQLKVAASDVRIQLPESYIVTYRVNAGTLKLPDGTTIDGQGTGTVNHAQPGSPVLRITLNLTASEVALT